jgi:aminopeptidase N
MFNAEWNSTNRLSNRLFHHTLICLFQVRVWARPGELHKTGLALHRSRQILERMEDYLGVPYEINKIGELSIASAI